MNGLTVNVLNHPGWVRFNERKWGLAAKEISFGEESSSSTFARVMVYLNSSNKIRTPTRSPYLAIDFRPTSTPSRQKQERQWLEASETIAEEMRSLGYGGAVSLDPSITDVRAWQRSGARAEVRYTYILALPFSTQNASNAVRKNIKKSMRAGYVCERTDDFESVVACLHETEQRQQFSYDLNALDLQQLQQDIGADHCRMYICREPGGAVVSSRVILHSPGGRAIDWIAGTNTDHLQDGVTQLLISYVLDDLYDAGATSFDYGGANIDSVARSKMEWGGVLTPFYTLRPNSVRTVVQDAQRWAGSSLRNLRRKV